MTEVRSCLCMNYKTTFFQVKKMVPRNIVEIKSFLFMYGQDTFAAH